MRNPAPTSHRNGETWLDSSGQLINAHGGGVIFHEGLYYWIGESRSGKSSVGVNLYRSRDLLSWDFVTTVIAPRKDDATHPLADGCIFERPKLLVNPRTKKFVCWWHHEMAGQGYSAAMLGRAVANRIEGPYDFAGVERPNGNESRDMTAIVAHDGNAFVMYSSRSNYDLHVVKLEDDFVNISKEDHKLFGEHREAPALFRHNGRWFLVTSGCTGWNPNPAELHTADKLRGPWRKLGNPCTGPNAEMTFGSQSTFIFERHDRPGEFVFMADTWKPGELERSGYVWLPIDLRGETPTIPWKDEWRP